MKETCPLSLICGYWMVDRFHGAWPERVTSRTLPGVPAQTPWSSPDVAPSPCARRPWKTTSPAALTAVQSDTSRNGAVVPGAAASNPRASSRSSPGRPTQRPLSKNDVCGRGTYD
jgi:hypothetical protein